MPSNINAKLTIENDGWTCGDGCCSDHWTNFIFRSEKGNGTLNEVRGESFEETIPLDVVDMILGSIDLPDLESEKKDFSHDEVKEILGRAGFRLEIDDGR